MDWSLTVGLAHPYRHQEEVAAAVLRGESVVVRAPTGSGKTEAVCGPFLYSLLRGGRLPGRLIYSLPMRVLATSLRDRVRAWPAGVEAWCQHGDAPESPLFERPLVFATIDQTIGSFLTCPPTLPVKLGNLAAGAVAGAMLAFDEVQLFDPRRALQAMFVLLGHQRALGIPFAVVSATLPDVLVERLCRDFGGGVVIEVDEASVPSRRGRQVVVRQVTGGTGLPLGDILAAAEEGDGNVAVICNTVERAQQAYRALSERLGSRVVLLHARFLPQRRREIESSILEGCGKGPGGYRRSGMVVVATQVIEAGLDASFDWLFTEVAPVDSVIQRAGRVARGGGEGRVVVFAPEGEAPHAPYTAELVERSKAALQEVEVLDWETEKRLVNAVLNDYLAPFLSEMAEGVMVQVMRKAASEGSRPQAQQTVRDTATCSLSIYAATGAEEGLRDLPRIGVHKGLLRRWWREGVIGRLQRVETAWDDMDDRGRPSVRLVEVQRAEDIREEGHYLCSPQHACHDAALGLVVGQAGESFAPVPRAGRPELASERRCETWQDHALRAAEAMEKHFLDRERWLWEAVAQWWNISHEKVREDLLSVAVLHDLGKLNVEWQRRAGWTGGRPLAHTAEEVTGLPHHATVGAYLLDFVWQKTPWLDALLLCIQHHHSPRAEAVPRYRLIGGWEEEVNRALARAGLPSIDWEACPSEQSAQTKCSQRQPSFDLAPQYVTYCLVSRALRLADWVATGGGDYEATVLGYEDWFRNV